MKRLHTEGYKENESNSFQSSSVGVWQEKQCSLKV